MSIDSRNFFVFSDRIVPICLPDSGPILTKSFVGSNPFFGNYSSIGLNYADISNLKCSYDCLSYLHLHLIAGWGKTKEGSKSFQPVLQQIQLPVITNAECKQKYTTLGNPFKAEIQNKFNTDAVICAGYAEGGKDTVSIE